MNIQTKPTPVELEVLLEAYYLRQPTAKVSPAFVEAQNTLTRQGFIREAVPGLKTSVFETTRDGNEWVERLLQVPPRSHL